MQGEGKGHGSRRITEWSAGREGCGTGKSSAACAPGCAESKIGKMVEIGRLEGQRQERLWSLVRRARKLSGRIAPRQQAMHGAGEARGCEARGCEARGWPQGPGAGASACRGLWTVAGGEARGHGTGGGGDSLGTSNALKYLYRPRPQPNPRLPWPARQSERSVKRPSSIQLYTLQCVICGKERARAERAQARASSETPHTHTLPPTLTHRTPTGRPSQIPIITHHPTYNIF